MAQRPWAEDIERANAEARQPVLFLSDHCSGANGWEPWIDGFERAGYVTLTLALPVTAPPATAADGLAQTVEAIAHAVQALSSRPAIVGRGLGGLVVQKLAAANLPAASVAITPPEPSTPAPALGGPLLLVVAGDAAARLPAGIARSEWEVIVLPEDEQPLPLDPRWEALADTVLTFIQRFV